LKATNLNHQWDSILRPICTNAEGRDDTSEMLLYKHKKVSE
jgi:hypothetical protein